jgi:hypothetical protein
VARPVELTLYSRVYCHLCHDMEALVRPICDEFGIPLTILDVDADADLEGRFNAKIKHLSDSVGGLRPNRPGLPADRFRTRNPS